MHTQTNADDAEFFRYIYMHVLRIIGQPYLSKHEAIDLKSWSHYYKI